VTISRPVFIHDNNVATNLFRIAEEAVNSAATQGGSKRIQITLTEAGPAVTLAIRDDGKPIKERQNDSLGAHMMRYHARIIGGLLEWRRESPRGVVFTCRFQKRTAAAR
jgi:two-component system CheB/CheR fusion protein